MNVDSAIESLLQRFIDPVIDKMSELGVESVEKIQVNFQTCFTSYLQRNYERYSKVKTILYKERPVYIRNFYVRTDLEASGLKSVVVSENDFLSLLRKERRLAINGTAGSGKSTFCKSIFVDLVETPQEFVPLFVELRHLNGKKILSIVEHIHGMLIEYEKSFTLRQLEYALGHGKIVLILDGYDEIDPEHKEFYERNIMELSSLYQNIYVIVSSRPDPCFSSWEEFYSYKVMPLDKERALSLVSKLDYDRQVKGGFIRDLNDSLYEKHNSFASCPLLLVMMLMTYEQIAEIPNKMHLFYEQAFLTLFNRHDSTKSLYKRTSTTGLPLDEFKKVLSHFCAFSYSDSIYFFSDTNIYTILDKSISLSGVSTNSEKLLRDLLDNVCILQRDGLGYSFTHRSFQEYFTAVFMVGMSGDNKFKIFDKLIFTNPHDSVADMLFDMNQGLLESEWIIPKLRSLVVIFEDYDLDDPYNQAQFFPIIFDELLLNHDVKENHFEVAYKLAVGGDNFSHFLVLLERFYSDIWWLTFGRDDFFSSVVDTALGKELFEKFQSNRVQLVAFDESGREGVEEALKILANNNGCYLVNRQIHFARGLLKELDSKQAARQQSLESLLS